MAWATFPIAAFQVLGGSLAQVRSSKRVVRSFCPGCGTAFTYAHDARPGELDVAVATLDDASALAPERHIWVAQKLAWVVIGDGLPQHAEWH